MLRNIFGFNWRKSQPHLLLLSKFLKPGVVEDFTKSEIWESVLGESPEAAIDRFKSERLLIAANLNAQIDYHYSLIELKNLLRQNGLSTTGRKEILIDRLIQADRNWMKSSVLYSQVLICSEQGLEIANHYLAGENVNRAIVEAKTIDCLKYSKFEDASRIVAGYEANQVFPRGMGIDWKNHRPERDIKILDIIFTRRPKILAALSEEQVSGIRIIAGMMYLFGINKVKKEWVNEALVATTAINNDTAARMFIFFASHQVSLADYRDGCSSFRTTPIGHFTSFKTALFALPAGFGLGTLPPRY